MGRWVRVARVDDCPPGQGREIVAEDRLLALFRVGDEWHVLDGVCPHQGGPLGKGALCGAIVTCPWHGWQFDVATGQHQLHGGLRQPSFPTRIVGDEVHVELP